MATFVYLTINPEALIASMLPPTDFGQYLSTGTKNRNRSEAIFFEIDPGNAGEIVDGSSIAKRCVMKPDGSPKSSVYLSVYRVLETVPLTAFKSLYLTTETGYTLEIKGKKYEPRSERKGFHLYQELCPVTPLIATDYSPSQFMLHLTDGSTPIVLPKLFFVELKLGALALNPLTGSVEYLPYANVGHLRDCFEIIINEEDKHMKTVRRTFSGSILYRTIEGGFYLGSESETLYFPFPTMADLENSNYEFFRAV